MVEHAGRVKITRHRKRQVARIEVARMMIDQPGTREPAQALWRTERVQPVAVRTEDLAAKWAANPPRCRSIWVKGSRGMALERAVKALDPQN